MRCANVSVVVIVRELLRVSIIESRNVTLTIRACRDRYRRASKRKGRALYRWRVAEIGTPISSWYLYGAAPELLVAAASVFTKNVAVTI